MHEIRTKIPVVLMNGLFGVKGLVARQRQNIQIILRLCTADVLIGDLILFTDLIQKLGKGGADPPDFQNGVVNPVRIVEKTEMIRILRIFQPFFDKAAA